MFNKIQKPIINEQEEFDRPIPRNERDQDHSQHSLTKNRLKANQERNRFFTPKNINQFTFQNAIQKGSQVFEMVKNKLIQNNVMKEEETENHKIEDDEAEINGKKNDNDQNSDYFKQKYSKRQEKVVQMRRYQSSSIDEVEFVNYQENPVQRQQFDLQRQKQQMREIQNIDQFLLVSYGFKKTKAEALIVAQTEVLDAEKKEEESKEQNEDEDEAQVYAAVSLCCLSSSNPFRSRIIQLVTQNQWVQMFFTSVIISNSLVLAMDQEVDFITNNGDTIDLCYLCLYTFEMILKIIAMGFFMETNSYLRDTWNVLDFIVVMCGWLSILVENPAIAQIKILRILRPIKLIKKVPGMPKLVSTILDSIPVMIDVMVLFMFFILLMAVVSVQLLGGSLQKRCTGIDADGKQWFKLGTEEKEYFCQTQDTCDALVIESEPGQVYQCLYQGNPWNDNFSYDNVLMAILNIFITIALDQWCDQMFYIRDAQEGTLYDIIFVSEVFIGNFVILVLLINVQAFFLDQAFDKEQEIQKEQKEKLDLKTKTNNMYLDKIKSSVQKNVNNKDDNQIQKNKKVKQKRPKKPSKILECLTSTSNHIQDFCESTFFNRSIFIIIIVNTLVMASEFYDQPQWLTIIQLYLNYTFTGIFTLEMVLKISGYGFKKYAEDSYNLFDCFVVMMSFVDIATSGSNSNLAIIKAFRLLRIFKLFKDWAAIKDLISTLTKSLKPIINLGVLMLLFNFISSLLLKNINGKPLYGYDGEIFSMNFNTTTQAMLTNFIYMTGDTWVELMNHSKDEFKNPVMYIIMVIIFTLGHFMLLNLFLCVLLRAMSQEDDTPIEPDQIESKNTENANVKQDVDATLEEGLKKDEQKSNFCCCFKKKPENDEQSDQYMKTINKDLDEKTNGQKIEEELLNKDKQNAIVKEQLLQKLRQAFQAKLEKAQEEINQRQNSNSRTNGTDSLQSDIEVEVQIIQDQLMSMTSTLKFQVKAKNISKSKKMNFKSIADQDDNKESIVKKKKCVRKVIKKEQFESAQQQKDNQKGKSLEQLQNQIEKPTDKSLFIFDSNGKTRIYVTQLINHPYYNSFLNHIIALSTVMLMFDEPQLKDNFQIRVIKLIQNVTSSIFIVEFLLNIISKGFYFGENAYLKNNWSILDFMIVVFTLLTWILESLLPNAGPIKGFKALRALRPLKIVSTNESLKIVVYSIFEAIPELANVALIVVLFLLIFGILGIQLFKGSVGSCNDTDPSILTKQDCIGNFTSIQEFEDGQNITQITDREWSVDIRNYDNVFNSMLTFFELATGDNWAAAMFTAMNTVGYDQVMVEDNRTWVQGIYVMFIFLLSFFILNLFISVIVDKFNDQISEYQGIKELEQQQKEWIKIQKLMVLTKPKNLPIIPFNSFRLKCFNLVQSDAFEYMSILAIIINTIFLCIDHYGQDDNFVKTLYISNYVMTVYFSIEIILKLIAYGFEFFWSQVWNKFDAVIVFISIIGLFEQQIESLGINVKLLRILRVTRLLRIIKTSSGIRKLLKTLIMSLSNILNVFFLLILQWFVFTVVGMSVYSSQVYGEVYSENANFTSFYLSMIMMVRVSTGDAWSDLMHEMTEDQGISTVLFWLTNIIVVQLILMNVFIAVIGESFGANQETDDQNDIITLKKKDIKSFLNTWAVINPLGEDMMKTVRFAEFLQLLPPPLGYKGINLQLSVVYKIIFCLNIRDRGGKLYFPEVMWPIFHSLGGFNAEKVLKCQEMIKTMRMIKKNFKHLSKSVTLDQLCGNYYLRDQISAIKYIYGDLIQRRWKIYKMKKNLKKRIALQAQFKQVLTQIKENKLRIKNKDDDEDKDGNKKQYLNY